MSDPLRELRIVVSIFAVLALALFAYVVAQSYSGRMEVHDSQIAGCNRGKLDRAQNALGWRTAQEARHIAYEADHRASDLFAMERYDAIARDLERRARIDCAKAFPHPTLSP